MEGYMVWRVIQPDILEVVVTCLAGILEHSRLENRHTHCTHDAWFRFARVNEFGINAFEILRQQIFISLSQDTLWTAR